MTDFFRTGLLALALAASAALGAEPAALLAFDSPEGLGRLARAGAKADFPALANQFEPQSNIAFCGPTSAAIVLNALYAQRGNAPRDRSRLRPDDQKHLPEGLDLSLPRYTQESVIERGPKSRAQVLGEPLTINGKVIHDGGFQLRQLAATLRANGAATRVVVADATVTDAQIRADLIGNLELPGDYVIVNYRRDAVGQPGGAHISPLGAYDRESDSVLLMDVNPTNAGWVWMPVDTLIRGMRTFDTVENRGYLLVSAP
ncbi:hypothetical protein GCM10025771_22030 [Niveibacterium umoris]|uniref:glutathione gamma-glutamylcysteinyltransferase n=1 Tax=Niveibacterium umoris TaxID=1193620 RepID=A0A840BM21_9RHOO|nr:phytochelatin synthase family protein [Niveibacterium umoris]MBB4012608.1 hypothetical protein [Niveibacterium umoris]